MVAKVAPPQEPAGTLVVALYMVVAMFEQVEPGIRVVAPAQLSFTGVCANNENGRLKKMSKTIHRDGVQACKIFFISIDSLVQQDDGSFKISENHAQPQ